MKYIKKKWYLSCQVAMSTVGLEEREWQAGDRSVEWHIRQEEEERPLGQNFAGAETQIRKQAMQLSGKSISEEIQTKGRGRCRKWTVCRVAG